MKNSEGFMSTVFACAMITGIYTPGKPSSPRVTSVTGRSVTLEWTAPESDGGSHITGYVVIYGSPDAHRALFREFVKGPATCCTLTDKLCPGRTYQFAVAATNKNKVGCREFSDFSFSFTSSAESGNSF